jgi:hypothetical protein
MRTVMIPGWDTRIEYEPSYDTSNFVNEGTFFDTHPGVTRNVKRYEKLDGSGNVIESWERNEKGVMVDVTKRDKLRAEIVAAQEALNNIKEKESKHGQKETG